MPDTKIFTICRKRTVVQISTEQYTAASEAEALDFANQDQSDEAVDDSNEWMDLSDVTEYPILDSDDIMEVIDSE